MPLPSIGGGKFLPYKGIPVIKLYLHGHANRPFFHIVITNKYAKVGTHPVEQLGTYDPIPNKDNQKLLSLNIERTRYWMGEGAAFSKGVAQLLGRAGFLPIHPRTYTGAWRYRHKEDTEEKKKVAEASADNQPPSSSS